MKIWLLHRDDRFARVARAALCLAACLIAPVPYAAAQVDTGGISGTVTDSSGAAVPGVSVTVTNLATGQARTTETNEAGRYLVTALQPARYSVKAELTGFTTAVQPDVRVNVGSAIDVNLSLTVGDLTETTTVTVDVPLIESTKTDLSNVVSEEVIENVPSKSRQFLDFALLMPATVENTSTSAQGSGVNLGGARAKENAVLVDGFYNQDEGFAKVKQRYSQDSIQEFQIISFAGAAEYGRAIGGVINAVTRSGGNTFRGTAYGFFRDTSLNAQDFLQKARGIDEKADFSRQQWGGTLGGPIVANRTFFFGAYERVSEDKPFDNSITAENAAIIGLRPEDAGNVPAYYRLNFVMGKVDHALSDTQRLQASFALSRWDEYNQSPAAFRTPSAAYGLKAPDYSYLLKWSRVSHDGRRLHEAKLSYAPRFYGVYGLNVGGQPLTPNGQINPERQTSASPPTVTITSVATFGAASLNNKIDTHPVQGLYSSTFFNGKHTYKFGADVMTAYYDYNLFSQLNGNYSFSSLANFQAGRYNQYSQAFGDAHNPRWHQYISAFAQDSWQASPRLTMNYGVRYDVELNPKHKASGLAMGNDYNNIAPRFGLSYDLTGTGRTFLKLGTGVYYDRLFQNITTFYTQLKGYEQLISGTWTPTTPGAPVYPQVFATQPASIPAATLDSYIMPDRVNVPGSGQIVGTVEHALRPTISVSASAVYTRTWHREYRWDTNLAWDDAAARWIRLDPAYRQLLQYRFDGKAEYVGGIFEVTKRGKAFGFNANLTLARAYESSSNYSSLVNDQRDGLAADWGPQTDTPTVRGVVSGWFNFARAMQISGAFRARTGMAVTATAAGLDLNGDGVLGDRTPGFSRNSERTSGMNALDVRYTWAVPAGANRRLNLYVEAFNVLNTESVMSVNSDYGAVNGSPKATWMTPTAYFPPREIQLGARLTF